MPYLRIQSMHLHARTHTILWALQGGGDKSLSIHAGNSDQDADFHAGSALRRVLDSPSRPAGQPSGHTSCPSVTVVGTEPTHRPPPPTTAHGSDDN